VGVAASVRLGGGALELCVKPADPAFGAPAGASVAVDGVCLTVEKTDGAGRMFFTAVAETLSRTTTGKIKPGGRVNLERAMRADGRIDGHIVLGHVDAVGRIVNDERAGVSIVRRIELPEELFPLTAEKGSIAVDGISLTIAEAKRGTVSISLIPATLANTTMEEKRVGDNVNIECDVLARYIYNMIKAESFSVSNIDNEETLIDKLKRMGF
jgi:riboflavin synthase